MSRLKSWNFLKTLGFWVIVAMLLGIGFGARFPQYACSPYIKDILDIFLRGIKLMVCPIVFLTVITGMVGMGSLKRLGSLGWKAFVYFEVASTLALMMGLFMGYLFHPGRGMNLSLHSVQDVSLGFTVPAIHPVCSFGDLLKQATPQNFWTPFIEGSTLQVFVLALGSGIMLLFLSPRLQQKIMPQLLRLQHLIFKLLKIFLWLSPAACFSAMAFMIGKFHFSILWQMAGLIGVMALSCILFVFVMLGAVTTYYDVNIFKLLHYIRKELLLVFATSSSESALVPLMEKMEHIGVSKSVVGMVIPSGFSFNLDGINIYLTLAIMFLAQAFNIPLSFKELIGILLVAMITSKGAAGVTNSGFIVLASTLSVLNGKIPVACLSILLGVDKLNSEMRAITSLIGNCVATLVVGFWTGEVDRKQLDKTLEKEF